MLTLTPLPYSYAGLEPVISARSVRAHHDVLQARYVEGFNKLLKKHPKLAEYGSLATLFTQLGEVRKRFGRQAAEDAEFYGGGAANHEFYWKVTDPSNSLPSLALIRAVQKDMGGVGEMLQQLKQVSLGIRGSSWGWLVYDLDACGLRVTSTSDQTSPLVFRQYPVIGVDVWEHAYYLDYTTQRAEYLDRWCDLINWQTVSAAFAQATEFPA